MEHETFWTLLKDGAHWEFELFLIFIFDVVIGLVIWPYLRRFMKHHRGDDDMIAELQREMAVVKTHVGLETTANKSCGCSHCKGHKS